MHTYIQTIHTYIHTYIHTDHTYIQTVHTDHTYIQTVHTFIVRRYFACWAKLALATTALNASQSPPVLAQAKRRLSLAAVILSFCFVLVVMLASIRRVIVSRDSTEMHSDRHLIKMCSIRQLEGAAAPRRVNLCSPLGWTPGRCRLHRRTRTRTGTRTLMIIIRIPRPVEHAVADTYVGTTRSLSQKRVMSMAAIRACHW